MSEAITKTTPTRRRRGVSNSDIARADAWLIGLCEEFMAIDEEDDRLWQSSEKARERLRARTAARSLELLNTIFVTPATAPLGLVAKAKIAAKLVSRDNTGQPFYRDRPLNSLATDILTQAPEAQGDGELLAAAAAFHKFTAEDVAYWKAIGEEDDRDNKHWNAWNADGGLWTRLYAATRRTCELPAKTPEGLRAKAGVVEALIIEHHGPEERGDWDEAVEAAMSLVRDLVGAAA
jgi:hypothetical protein